MSKVNIDLTEELSEEIEKLATEMGANFEDTLLEVIKEGINGLKKKVVKKKLESGEWTLRKAARFLGIPFKSIVEFVEKEKIELGKRPII